MTRNARTVLILGHGEMGRAMEALLADRHALTVWECHPDSGAESAPLEQLAADREFVLCCVPAAPHAQLATRLAPRLGPQAVVLTVAKGLDAVGRTPADALAAVLGASARIGVLYGPMIAEELSAGRPGFGVLGSVSEEVRSRGRRLFDGTRLYLQEGTDVAGLSWAVILKNVYVPLLGAAEELGLGDNMRGFLISASLAEMARLITQRGGCAESAYGPAGIGDLVTTATSAGSHHREIGRALARGETTGTGVISGEGPHTLAVVERLSLLDTSACPLYKLMQALIRDPRDLRARLLACIGQLDPFERRTP